MAGMTLVLRSLTVLALVACGATRPPVAQEPAPTGDAAAIARVDRAGWREAVVLARDPALTVLSGEREGRRELLLLGDDAAAPPVVLSAIEPAGARVTATVGAFAHAAGVLRVETSATWDDDRATWTRQSTYLIRAGARPEIVCGLPDRVAQHSQSCDHSWSEMDVKPVPGQDGSFEVTVRGYASSGERVGGECQPNDPGESWPERFRYRLPSTGTCTREELRDDDPVSARGR